MTCGIYALINAVNGKRYVGQSINIERRWRGHVNELRSGRHNNSHLTNAWRTYGEAAFTIQILQECQENKTIMAEAEQLWIDRLNVTNRDMGYNIAPVAASNLGVKRSAEARAKMSAAKLKMTDETKQKLRLANLGKKQSEETRAKRSASCRNPSPETRARMSAASKGRKPTQATRDVLRALNPAGVTGARGIHVNGNGFCVRFKHNGKRHYAGQHRTIEKAITARDAAFANLKITTQGI